MFSHRVIRMSITLAVIIGIALPAMVQQVPAAERKSKKGQHKPINRKTVSKTESVGSAAGKKGNLLVPKALVSAFRNTLQAHKIHLEAKLKQKQRATKLAQNLHNLLRKLREHLPSSDEEEKKMIAVALRQSFGLILPAVQSAQTFVEEAGHHLYEGKNLEESAEIAVDLSSLLDTHPKVSAQQPGKWNTLSGAGMAIGTLNYHLREIRSTVESLKREIETRNTLNIMAHTEGRMH